MYLAKKDDIITNVKTLETENIFLYCDVVSIDFKAIKEKI